MTKQRWMLPILNAVLLTTISACTSASSMESVTVIRVIDGDTFDAITADGDEVRVRVLGIDTPEIAHDSSTAQCGADAARENLSSLISEALVELHSDPGSNITDQYGRLLRYVTVDGLDVGARQVADGMGTAWYPASAAPPSRHMKYLSYETLAHLTGTGVWASCPSAGR